MSEATERRWNCNLCDWYSTQFLYSDPARTSTSDDLHRAELAAHIDAMHCGDVGSGCVSCGVRSGKHWPGCPTPYVARDLNRAIAAIESSWDEQCCGNRNVVVCESCRAYDDAIRAVSRVREGLGQQ